MARPLEILKYQAQNKVTHYKKPIIPKVDLSQLIMDIYVNEIEIKENLNTYFQNLIKTNHKFSFQSLIDEYPIKYGLAETLTYLSIIYKSKWARVSKNEFETIIFNNNDNLNSKITLSIPKVEITNE